MGVEGLKIMRGFSFTCDHFCPYYQRTPWHIISHKIFIISRMYTIVCMLNIKSQKVRLTYPAVVSQWEPASQSILI